MNKPASLLLLTFLFAGCCQHASGFYNPSTGRWLNRDTIDEKGGPNLYALVHNSAVAKIDPLGKQPWSGWPGGPWGPPVYPFGWCDCKCQYPTIEYHPGGAIMGLDWYSDTGGHDIFGNRVHVTWHVDGNPRKCRYFQEEGEAVTVVTDPYGYVHYQGGTSGERSQIYWDFMHVGPFPDSRYDGTWHITVYWEVIFRCQSSSGENTTRVDSWTASAVFEVPHSIIR